MKHNFHSTPAYQVSVYSILCSLKAARQPTHTILDSFRGLSMLREYKIPTSRHIRGPDRINANDSKDLLCLTPAEVIVIKFGT